MVPPSGLRATLRGLAWARLLVAGLVLTAAAWLRSLEVFVYRVDLLLLALVGMALASLLTLAGPRRLGDSPRFAWLSVCLDVVLVTAVVAVTGGARSLFTFIYVLAVLEGCLALSRTGGIAIAGLSSALYIGLVLGRTIVPLLDEWFEPTETTALEVLTVFVNAAVLMGAAIVAGSLAEQYQVARQDLEAHQRHLGDVRAFRDLIFESVGAGLVALDTHGRITAFNRAAEVISGVPAEAALGQPWAAVFGPAVALDAVQGALARGEERSERHEFVLARPDGRSVPVGISFWQLRAGDGHVVGVIGVCQDLSSIKELEARMRQADRLAALGRLAANIAHEIRNPLASISGAIEVLVRELPPDAAQGRLAEIVLQESARLNGLIAEFLDYARPTPPSVGPIDAAAVLDEVLTLLEHRPHPGAVKVVRRYPERLPALGDGARLRQAVWNLCLNAVQAMPEGGELTVGARAATGAAGEPRVELWVADTGHGIAEGDLAHIFEPFYTSRPGGSGLGLAMVYRIVQEHGGLVDVRSAPDAGTTFTLTLPAPPGPA